ncbi:MAG: DUF1700 domain-containing protein [Hungatella sp.]
MRKDEFLQLLRQALAGDVPSGVIEENIRYYDHYISEEVQKGMSEEEVIAEIGDPRLIARTIEDTTDGTSETGYTDPMDDRSSQSQSQSTYREDSYGSQGNTHTFRLNRWYWKLLAALVIFGIVYLVFMVVGGIFTLLSPLLGPLFVIWIITWIFRMLKRR